MRAIGVTNGMMKRISALRPRLRLLCANYHALTIATRIPPIGTTTSCNQLLPCQEQQQHILHNNNLKIYHAADSSSLRKYETFTIRNRFYSRSTASEFRRHQQHRFTDSTTITSINKQTTISFSTSTSKVDSDPFREDAPSPFGDDDDDDDDGLEVYIEEVDAAEDEHDSVEMNNDDDEQDPKNNIVQIDELDQDDIDFTAISTTTANEDTENELQDTDIKPTNLLDFNSETYKQRVLGMITTGGSSAGQSRYEEKFFRFREDELLQLNSTITATSTSDSSIRTNENQQQQQQQPLVSLSEAFSYFRTSRDRYIHGITTYELRTKLNLEPNWKDQQLTGKFVVPHSITLQQQQQRPRVCVLTSNRDWRQSSLHNGACCVGEYNVGDTDFHVRFADNTTDSFQLHRIYNSNNNNGRRLPFDMVIATNDFHPFISEPKSKFGKFARFLRNNGIALPSYESDTITRRRQKELLDAVVLYTSGRARMYCLDKEGYVRTAFGIYGTHDEKQMFDNLCSILQTIVRDKPINYGTAPNAKRENRNKFVLEVSMCVSTTAPTHHHHNDEHRQQLHTAASSMKDQTSSDGNSPIFDNNGSGSNAKTHTSTINTTKKKEKQRKTTTIVSDNVQLDISKLTALHGHDQYITNHQRRNAQRNLFKPQRKIKIQF